MVILITGASHTGKTVLAQRMLEKYQYPYLSIDHLKMGLIRSGNTELTPEDDDKLTEYLWPVVREMVKTAIENQQNLIVEGCYIPYEWRKDFDAAYLPNIRFICLSMSKNYIASHFAEIINHGNDIEKRIDDSYCTKEWLTQENERIMNGFRQVGEQVVFIDDYYERAIGTLFENANG
ncbi:MAG: AAA family ATPase [Oscillospiraceae bacterium]|nr:AAA family ATPase [Oscillospiraceae bacterium]